jgi:hypothetical protein
LLDLFHNRKIAEDQLQRHFLKLPQDALANFLRLWRRVNQLAFDDDGREQGLELAAAGAFFNGHACGKNFARAAGGAFDQIFAPDFLPRLPAACR